MSSRVPGNEFVQMNLVVWTRHNDFFTISYKTLIYIWYIIYKKLTTLNKGLIERNANTKELLFNGLYEKQSYLKGNEDFVKTEIGYKKTSLNWKWKKTNSQRMLLKLQKYLFAYFVYKFLSPFS